MGAAIAAGTLPSPFSTSMRLLLLLSLLLAGCTDATEATESTPLATTPETEAVAAATPSGETAAPAPEASGDAPVPSAADPTTIGGFLDALQTAAASGDASAFDRFLELDPDEREMFDEYIAEALLPGSEWHDLLMDLTVDDLDEAEGGAYTASLLSTTVEDGETYESAIVFRFAQLGDDFRIISALMAG